jgi:trimeric autotransporter adhesin
MAFSGGTFSRTFDCTTDRDNGVKILASKFDTELDGMATGLSTCILKDGTQTCTAAIPFAQGITLPDNKTIILGTNSDVTIQYDETTNDSLEIAANVEGAALGIVLKADQGDDAGDEWKLNIADGGTLTLGNDIASAGSYVTHLTITPNSTVSNSTTAVAGNLTVGGDLTLGSGAVISEAELETIDGITPGTAAASKAMVLDASLDISGGRNLTISGELDAGSLDISGSVDIDGTLETDGFSIEGTAVTATGAELNYSDTGAAVGTVVASKVVTADANKDVASFRNITLTGELDAGSLDVSGDADIDGTLEADAMTLNGTAITATATLDTGISNNNVPKFTSGVADDDFLRVAGTAIEGRSAAEVLSDIGGQASLTFGISNTNAVKIDSSSVADDEYARFTANGLESRASSEVLSDIAASPAAGSSSIVTTGALNAGSITSGFGSIDNGSSAITTTGVITGGTLEATTDTAAGDNAAIGYTAAEGLILTGQGSTSDITLKNDADATVFTVPTGTDDILFPDNAKAMFGAGSDLQIYHDGSVSRVVNITSNLKLQSDIFEILNESGTEQYITAVYNGAVTLSHNNSGKLATTSTGVDITGTITSDGLTVDGGTIKLDGNYPTGTNNVALGNTALDDGSLSGGNNTAIGSAALSSTTSGADNTAVGFNVLSTNQTGSSNTAIGKSALSLNTGGSNVAVGRSALENNSTASNNTAVGANALDANTTGTGNFAAGYRAGTATTTGSSNTFVGQDAGVTNTTSGFNTYVGGSDGVTGGAGGSTTGEKNTFIGNGAGSQITSGADNTIIGRYNGNQGGFDLRTASNNVVISDGDGNIILGYRSADNTTQMQYVYSNTTSTAANVAILSSGTISRSTSSRRYKNTINDATHGLTELLALRPVTFKGNNDGDTVFGGLIAEEVHDAGLTEFVEYNDDTEPDALAYGNMVSLCIKAIQEQQATITALTKRIEALEA